MKRLHLPILLVSLTALVSGCDTGRRADAREYGASGDTVIDSDIGTDYGDDSDSGLSIDTAVDVNSDADTTSPNRTDSVAGTDGAENVDTGIGHDGPIKLHPIGDSTTEAYELESAWRYWLWKDLAQGPISIDFVGSRQGTNMGSSFSDNDWDMDHDGHTSATASQVLNGGLPYGHGGSLREWAPEYEPDIAIVYLGTNDIRQGRPTPDIVGTLESIIGELREANPAVDIIVCQIPYWNYNVYGGNQEAVDALNEAIPNLTTLVTPASQVTIVNLNSDYFLSDLRDGIHPNASGAKKISNRLRPSVSGLLEGW